MKRLLFLGSLPLIGCYGGERWNSGQCPAGETCSDLTPSGLEFIGNGLSGELVLSGPRATAIGGTQTIALQYDRGDGVEIALDLPYTADDHGGQGVRVATTSGSQVTVTGAGSFANYLRILDSDGLLMDRKELTGAAVKAIQLVTPDYENVPYGSELAFAAGHRALGIALWGDVQGTLGPRTERLVDNSMDVDLAGATRTSWDELDVPNATVGSYPLTVTAGDKPAATLDFVVVDHADSVAAFQAPSAIAPNQSAQVCFQATTGMRYIAGLTWTFSVDGVTTVQGDDSVNRNCISVTTQKVTGTVSISAAAGGQTTAMALTVGAARGALEPARAISAAISTAGDRAAM